MIIGLFPGQGSQTPGFLSPWLELEGARERMAAYSDAAQVDLIAAGTDADADEIRDTKIAQPLIVAAALLSWHALAERTDAVIGGVAGHSVGELAAVAASGVLTDDDALRLVGIRGRAMAAAAAVSPTGMSAILGGDEETVLARLAELDLTPANRNGGGQIVAAGALDALTALASDAPRGTRVVPLQVAGAFHTHHMQPAVDALARAAAALAPNDPDRTLWTNSDGSVVAHGRAALDLLVGQVAAPVRWDLDMASFAEHGVTGLIEFAPAGTLVGLAKRGLRGTPAVAVKTPDDLDAAVALLAEENA
ncbi:ACP S-malonyltransferase [Microbacterium sp. cx-59]|uniref:ACP S-malonyltransferase n=1 Tax=Microbacterium sp. cx-59 TaxID=2891207 RepID=UPI001E5431CE|nr:ACP S-malonyltransferase [Microbacterium sp. cx-59]MCC4907267.1 ACP S-malonyltransferase [Microbacterium sp. cx-59]